MSDKGSRDELKGRASGAGAVAPVARLCYVDDSRTSAYVVRRLLQPYGYQVDYYQSAEPAFVALIQEDYDLLLTDLKVSSKGMDGDDLIRTLRQSGHPKLSSLPVIVITGATDARVLVDVYDAGANQVMNKPVDAEELDGHIRRLLPENKPELRVVEQQHDRDNVVSLAAAQRPVQKQPQSTDNSDSSSSPMPSPEEENKTPLPEAKSPEADIPVLDAASPVQSNVTQENDDVKQTDNLDDQNPETVSGAAAIKKESLLERAVLKQEELNEKQKNVEVGESQPEKGKEDTGAEGSAQDIVWPDDVQNIEDEIVIDSNESFNDQTIEDKIVIDPNESINGQNSTAEIAAESENILHEMDQHALVVRERTGLLSDSNILGAFGSLVELVGVKNLIKRIVMAGVVIFVVLMAWNILLDQGQSVETVMVETGEIFQSITVPGRVLSKQRVNISSAHTGRTVKILVKEGDRVKAGQVLAKMDDRELISRHNRAKANLAAAREGVVLARRTLNRLRKAYKKGAVARRFVEDAEIDLSSARSQAGIAVEEAHSANLELSKQEITAPFSGTITARFAEVGQWVGPSESLFTLVDESQREIEVRVDAADSVAIEVGQVVAVSSDAFPGLEWHESVSRLGTAANNDRNSNSVKVYISLGNEAPSLRFGQQVDADIRTAWNPNTLKVPFEALMSRDGQTFVAVLSGGRVKLKPVETGIEDFSMVEIKQGLNDGELVVLSKGQLLQNGDKVYPARNNR
ncbi:MAG: efflux RND transporter periplasmic adaptor subunit [Gammaproteobacteria bacterium]|nr:efflux RND transporter periplasmic adaptor subunit [Gammaproteobacteria bacterium]